MTARILIVEDNPINRELIDYLLRAYGFETLKAPDGHAGLEVARLERPDVILCDVQMPGMDGVEFVRQVRADAALAATPLIAVTALAMVGDRDRILGEGFDGYIAKPIEPTDFIATVNGFLPAPRRSDDDAPPQSSPQSSHSGVPAPAHASPRAAGRGRRILVLDDTPFNLELKRDLLIPHGFEVTTAQTAQEAWDAAKAQPPDLVISDVGSPVGSGFDFIRRVKADPVLRNVPFIFLTSTHWDSASRERGLGLGAMRYLVRPMDPARLLAEIEACLPPRRGDD